MTAKLLKIKEIFIYELQRMQFVQLSSSTIALKHFFLPLIFISPQKGKLLC